jgi:broad specificity phosphatase PhoE
MRLIVARHGQTDWNVQNRVLGRTDIPLNDVGRQQANMLAESVKKCNIRLVYVSPLLRAIETGEIVAEHNKVDLVIKNILIEQNFGIYEGIDRNDSNYQQAKRMYAKRYPDGESYFDVAARVYPFIDYIKNNRQDGVMIVTHGGICRIIDSYFEQLDNEKFASFKMPNCGYREYEL